MSGFFDTKFSRFLDEEVNKLDQESAQRAKELKQKWGIEIAPRPATEPRQGPRQGMQTKDLSERSNSTIPKISRPERKEGNTSTYKSSP